MSKAGFVAKGYATRQLPKNALFDRIINLRVITAAVDEEGNVTGEEDSFVIRSDFELKVDAKTGNTYLVRCDYKPSIKVEYDYVSSGTQINIKITVNNFHFYSLGPEYERNRISANNRILRIEVQMGYRRQFTDLIEEFSSITYEDYRTLKYLGEYPTNVRTLSCNVLAVYPVALPPDGAIMFSCMVGNVVSHISTEQDEEDTTVKFAKDISVEDFLYESITRRFPRKDITPIARTAVIDPKGLLIDDKKVIDDYGTRLYLSDALKKYEAPWLKGKLPPPPLPQGGTVAAAFTNFKNEYCKDFRYKQLRTGDYACYLLEEANDLSSLIASMDYKSVIDDDGTGKGIQIPAVYSISFGGMRTIKAMYFDLINPFTKVSFSARYNLSTLVGYYYQPEAGADFFYVTRVKVAFATVDDVNEMELISTDAKEEG